MLEVLLCILHLKNLLYHCGELLLGEGATLDVGEEAAQLLQREEGGLEGLLGPDPSILSPAALTAHSAGSLTSHSLVTTSSTSL